MGEGRTEGAQQDGAPKEYVTVGEAAKLLGIHRNTVHHRIRTGRITAHKVVEGGREIYRVERDSLGVGRTSAHVHTLDAQRTTASEELSRMIATRLDEIVRDYTHKLGDLREELGAERARREMAETTLREGMAEEQRRREEAERERDELRRWFHSEDEDTAARVAVGATSISGPQQRVAHHDETEVPEGDLGEAVSKARDPFYRWDRSDIWIFPITVLAAIGPAGATILIDGALYGPLPDFWGYLSPSLFLITIGLGYWMGRRAARVRVTLYLDRIAFTSGALSGVFILGGMAFLRPLYSDPISLLDPRVLIATLAVSVGTAMFFGSATYLGEARRRQVAPVTPPSVAHPSTGSSRPDHEAWTPRQQALIGFAGTTVSALLTFLGVLVQVLLSNGGGGNGG